MYVNKYVEQMYLENTNKSLYNGDYDYLQVLLPVWKVWNNKCTDVGNPWWTPLQTDKKTHKKSKYREMAKGSKARKSNLIKKIYTKKWTISYSLWSKILTICSK